MKEYLAKLPREIQDILRDVRSVAVEDAIPAYLVGGFVRDMLLGAQNFDLDIVVEGDGIEFAQALAARFQAKLTPHRRFGTATIALGRHLKIDIAGARKEYYPAPAHLPVVAPGHLKDDLFRRDFTINAMAVGIADHNYGIFLDFFGGKDDLKNKCVRVLHDKSFDDDPTRILRAVRFEQRYGFRIEPRTLKLLTHAARCAMLEKVEPQRLRDELIPMLKEAGAENGIRRLGALAGFSFIYPRLHLPAQARGLLRHVRCEVEWFRKSCGHRRRLDAWLIYLMALTDSLNEDQTREFSDRYVLRKGDAMRLLSVKKITARMLAPFFRRDVAPSRIFAFFEPLSYETVLMLKAKYRHSRLQRYIGDFLEIYNGIKIGVSGHDLHALGVAPGPFYQKIFSGVLHAKVDGLVETKEDELAFIRVLVKEREFLNKDAPVYQSPRLRSRPQSTDHSPQ